MKEWKCPNCGSPYNPAKFHCEYCGSFIVMSNEKEFTVPHDTISSMRQEIAKADNNEKKYPGIYFYGSLLGKGEIPLRLGAANYFKSRFDALGGKLLLTEKNLYFSTHTIFQEKTDYCINLLDIEVVSYVKHTILTDFISVTSMGKKYIFVVYGGKEWVSMIKEAVDKAKKKLDDVEIAKNIKLSQGDYMDELVRLKQLFDSGVITEEEYAIKKRQILGI